MAKKLTKLRISEISAVDRGAGEGVRVLLAKKDEGNEPYWKREFSQGERDEAAKSGAAMSDGSFPIKNKSDLHNAMQAIGRAKDPGKAKAHIRSRARALGLTGELSDAFKMDTRFRKEGTSPFIPPHELHEDESAAGVKAEEEEMQKARAKDVPYTPGGAAAFGYDPQQHGAAEAFSGERMASEDAAEAIADQKDWEESGFGEEETRSYEPEQYGGNPDEPSGTMWGGMGKRDGFSAWVSEQARSIVRKQRMGPEYYAADADPHQSREEEGIPTEEEEARANSPRPEDAGGPPEEWNLAEPILPLGKSFAAWISKQARNIMRKAERTYPLGSTHPPGTPEDEEGLAPEGTSYLETSGKLTEPNPEDTDPHQSPEAEKDWATESELAAYGLGKNIMRKEDTRSTDPEQYGGYEAYSVPGQLAADYQEHGGEEELEGLDEEEREAALGREPATDREVAGETYKSWLAKLFGFRKAQTQQAVEQATRALAKSVASISADESAKNKPELMAKTFAQFQDHLTKRLASQAVEQKGAAMSAIVAKALGLKEGVSEQDILKALAARDLALVKAKAKMTPAQEKAFDNEKDEEKKKRFLAASHEERHAMMNKSANLPEHVRKQLAEAEDMRKRLEKLEVERDLASFTKRAASLGLPETEGATLMKAHRGNREAIEKLEGFVKAGWAAAKAAGAFAEIGGVGKGVSTAMDEIRAKAAELRKQDAKLTNEQAFAKVYTDPAYADLVKRERNENRPRAVQ